MRTRLRSQDQLQERKPGRLLAFIIFVSLILLLAVRQVLINHAEEKEPVLSPLVITATPEVLSETTTQNDSLGTVVRKSLQGSQGIYGVVIKNLKTEESFSFNAHRVFQPGSLYKLWIMGATYEQIQQGKLQEEQELKEDVTVLNDKFDIAPEDAELTDGVIDFTVSGALRQMITISHNYAALLLTEKLRLSNVADYLKRNGLVESAVGKTGGSPTVTPSDIALFMEKLYKGQLANSTYTDEMIGLLKDQQLNNKFPKYLPDVVIAHKTGEIGAYTHDAGIVYLEDSPYLIVVLSQSDHPDQAEDKIAQLSKNVYQYFSAEK